MLAQSTRAVVLAGIAAALIAPGAALAQDAPPPRPQIIRGPNGEAVLNLRSPRPPETERGRQLNLALGLPPDAAIRILCLGDQPGGELDCGYQMDGERVVIAPEQMAMLWEQGLLPGLPSLARPDAEPGAIIEISPFTNSVVRE
jgi:hypothetical protein